MKLIRLDLNRGGRGIGYILLVQVVNVSDVRGR